MAKQCLVVTIMHQLGVESSASAKRGLQPSRTPVLSKDSVSKGATCEQLEKIVINDDLEKFFQVRTQLPPRETEKLIVLLQRNIDVFAWSAYEAPRVDPNLICHHLNVNPSVIPKKQPPWHSSKDHSDAVNDEVIKLKQAKTIKEVFYPEWLADIVVVKMKSEKWRVCVDFTDLDDQKKTTFVTPTGNYHYKVTPFRLKNAGSTYQRMMTKMFKPQLGKNIEVYIDDMVVKVRL